jgi:hypothetical protein|tara:strand:+ start:6098 stop:6370 length:273 start_codon:yes stop_codon:yes gene_type:complete
MDKSDQRDKLESLHTLLTEEFISRIQSGEAEPSLLSAARQFLKDNSVDAVVTDESPLNRLSGIVLPFEDGDKEVAKFPTHPTKNKRSTNN